MFHQMEMNKEKIKTIKEIKELNNFICRDIEYCSYGVFWIVIKHELGYKIEITFLLKLFLFLNTTTIVKMIKKANK